MVFSSGAVAWRGAPRIARATDARLKGRNLLGWEEVCRGR
jgi:hypothetical protein